MSAGAHPSRKDEEHNVPGVDTDRVREELCPLGQLEPRLDASYDAVKEAVDS